MCQGLLYLQINPLTLHSKDHLNDFQHLGQSTFPGVHFLFKGFNKPRCLHCGKCSLVVLQGLENLICPPVQEGEKQLDVTVCDCA